MPIDPISALSLGAKVLGGLFGKKEKTMTPAQSIMSTATGVTEASKATGINRLTLLGASNATAGAGMSMGGPPPLASALSVLGDGLQEFTPAANEAREHNRLQTELLRLEVDRARSVTKVAVPRSVASGGAITGRNVQYQTGGAVRQAGTYGPQPQIVTGQLVTEVKDEYGLNESERGDAADRATDKNRVQNEPWYKKMELGGRTYNVWNDEASDNEVMSGVMLLSIPGQYLAQKTNEAIKRYNAPDVAGSVKEYGKRAVARKPKLPPFYTHRETGFTARQR